VPYNHKPPWLWLAAGSALAGAIVGLGIAKDFSIPKAIFAGGIFALGLFSVVASWAWVESRPGRTEPSWRQRGRAWSRSHPWKWAVVAMLLTMAIVFTSETSQGQTLRSAALTAAVLGVVGFVVAGVIARVSGSEHRRK
jgi:hypothetical protein